MINSNKLQEKHYRLKYLYFIDSDQVIRNIQNSDVYKKWIEQDSEDCSELFYLIFSEIIRASKRYSEYILQSGSSFCIPFFNEDFGNKEIPTLQILSTVSLFHHCILHGFLDSIDLKQVTDSKSKFSTPNEYIRLSGATDHDIRNGYFRSLSSVNDKKHSADNNIFQYYNIRYREFFKHTEYYSYKLLHSLDNGTSEKILHLPKHKSNPALFLLTEPHTNVMNKNLQNPRINSIVFLKNYSKLLESASVWQQNLASLDYILFDSCIEYAYGFRLFSYISTLLDAMYNQSPENDNKLRYLKSEGFWEIIKKHIITLPVIYNRSVILKNVCRSVISTENVDSRYPSSPKTRQLGTPLSSNKQPQDLHSAKSLELIGKYFRMLHFITIPILEDLWDILTNKLVPTITNLNRIYAFYIEKHFEFITYDYSLLPDDVLSERYKYLEGPGFGNPYHDFSNTCKKLSQFVNNLPKISKLNAPAFTYKKEYSDDLKNLITSCCTYNHPKHWNLIDELLKSTDSSQYDSSFPVALDVFQSNHTKNLFDFVSLITE